VTEHEATPVEPATRLQAVDVKVPVELVVKLTVPVGLVGLLEVSVTVAVHVLGVLTVTEPGEQLTVMLVDATTGAVIVTLTLVAVVVAPRGEPVTMKLYEPAATEDATLIVNSLVPVGVTGLTVKLPQLIPAGRLLLTQDKVTG
jgi:hypothetical protein